MIIAEFFNSDGGLENGPNPHAPTTVQSNYFQLTYESVLDADGRQVATYNGYWLLNNGASYSDVIFRD